MIYDLLTFLQKEEKMLTAPEIACKLNIPPSRLYRGLYSLKKSEKICEKTLDQLLSDGK